MDKEVAEIKKNISLFAGGCAFIALAVFSQSLTDICKYALCLCAELIIPSLFPFFVLSICLNRMGLPSALGKALSPAASKIYGISGAGVSALVIGLTGGYPLGAVYISDMEKSGAITPGEGERLLAFCNNSGPAFIIGAVGIGVFHSSRIGLLLYASHILSALLTGLFFRSSNYCTQPQPPMLESLDLASALPEAVKQAVDGVLKVCGFVVCFTVLVGLLDSGGLVSLICGAISERTGLGLGFCRAMITGLLELGSGVGAMNGLSPGPMELSLAAGMLGWGGISVHFQTLAALSESRIKGALHLTGRLISGAIASISAFIFGLIFL